MSTVDPQHEGLIAAINHPISFGQNVSTWNAEVKLPNGGFVRIAYRRGLYDVLGCGLDLTSTDWRDVAEAINALHPQM